MVRDIGNGVMGRQFFLTGTDASVAADPMQWCKENLGLDTLVAPDNDKLPFWTDYDRADHAGVLLVIQNLDDAMLFKLRWCYG